MTHAPTSNYVMGFDGPIDVRDLDRESARVMAWNAKWDEFDAFVHTVHMEIMPKWAQVALTAENEDSERALDLYHEVCDRLDRLHLDFELADERGQFPPRDRITKARAEIEGVVSR